jgi:hypothetical protein
MIDWPVAFSTASQALKLANDLRSIDKELGQAELRLKIADLTTALAELKMTLTEAKNDAAEKDAEIARLKRLQRRVEEETVRIYGYRYRKRTDGEEGGTGNAFCDLCLQKEGLLVETIITPKQGIISYECPNCKTMYGILRSFPE